MTYFPADLQCTGLGGGGGHAALPPAHHRAHRVGLRRGRLHAARRLCRPVELSTGATERLQCTGLIYM